MNDIETIAASVFYSARDGRLKRLQLLLEGKSAMENAKLLKTTTTGATPLLMACRHGHYDIALYLIKRHKVDIEQTGSVMFDGETIEGAPPLWCAAAAGHLNIVKLLIRENAVVNSTTKTNSTPLRAACFDGHFEIVKYLVEHGADIEVSNRHGHTCLMIACYKGHYKIANFLLSLKADINKKSVKGNTALHDCAESGSLDIFKMLILNGAKMEVDSYGMTPLLAACVTGHADIVDYLVKSNNLVSRKEKIEALELLGATYIDKRRDLIGGFDLWKQAMDLRFSEDDDELDIPKPDNALPIEAYEWAQEVKNHEELNELLSEPDEMRMQALLVRERILGPTHPDTSYYVRYRGAVYADAGKFTRCISLWNHALDIQRGSLESCHQMTVSSFFSFAELFSFMSDACATNDNNGYRQVPALLTFEDIIQVLIKAVNELCEPKVLPSSFDLSPRLLLISLDLFNMALKLIRNDDQSHLTHRLLYRLNKCKVLGHMGQTALHLASARKTALATSRHPQFISSEDASMLLRALLKIGANPNARDEEGNTPLHLVSSKDVTTIKLLLGGGAHYDSVNAAGRTFCDMRKATPHNPLCHTSLACHAARAIRKNRIPFIGHIPVTLYEFVEKH
ncbi:PREDICTED: protein fem-1 homolog A isoform X1 [Diuraphis noxia]|uniref:protein fem-1 homolog A isoform X1 n=2 Tax=Diuraphis noxia TaxID=143948 RepID=UPI000763B6AC|nr:PREDICTED: protein fem-1 homolog A isoform X1 [Diuraphis noxia]